MPLCGSALMIDKVSPPQVVLPLLPARGQSGQQLALPGTRHVLSLQILPTGLHDINRTFKKAAHTACRQYLNVNGLKVIVSKNFI